ncbi:MAG: VOC family protein [Alphaproteobacteria bacterium]|jgi:catechol 2,3-dioxygenase-like lactoylglutathione lyase family enzyme|nr:VOC family protein [Alphaproteobacteria bacterium]
MALTRLDHFSIRTADVEKTRDFFVQILGLTNGDRPPFKFPGAWLYCGDKDVIHIIGIDPNDKSGLVDYLGDRDEAALTGTGAIDHLAFMADDLDATRARIEKAGIATREREVPLLGVRQVFLEDPNGVTIELNFPLD